MIDAHVYCLPPHLRQPDALLPSSDRLIQQAIHRHAEGPDALRLAAPRAILAAMDQAGITTSVLVAFPWQNADLCRQNNDYILNQVARHGRFKAIAAVSPSTSQALDEAQRALQAGAVGIKLNPVWQHFQLTDAAMTDLAQLIQQHQAFIMLHVDHPWKFSPASPAHLYALAGRQPHLKILAAHLGGLLGLSSLHPPVAQQLLNVWYDTAVSSTLTMVRWYCEAGLADRVVFGSDFPFNHSHSQQQVVAGLQALNLEPAVLTGILSTNFQRLTRGLAAKEHLS